MDFGSAVLTTYGLRFGLCKKIEKEKLHCVQMYFIVLGNHFDFFCHC